MFMFRTSKSVPVSLCNESSKARKATRFRFLLSLGLMLTLATALAQAKSYTKIVVFGDSLSDTGNVAHLSEAKYPFRVPGTAADYTDGRFTDGFDTIPAAQKYFGVWIEQFAASLPTHPEVKNSLDGGTNYAYGYATTADKTGELTFGDSDQYSVEVENIGQQINDYLATNPKINDSTLFVVWGGANDLIHAGQLTPDEVGPYLWNAATQETLNIQRLIEAGATQFIIPNLPPLGLVPRLNGSLATSGPATYAASVYNGFLATGISVLCDLYPHRNTTIYQLDVFTLFTAIVKSPASFSLGNVTDSSRGQFKVDPDTYLFWDDLHPTTHGHSILSDAAETLVSQHQCNSALHANCVFPVETEK